MHTYVHTIIKVYYNILRVGSGNPLFLLPLFFCLIFFFLCFPERAEFASSKHTPQKGINLHIFTFSHISLNRHFLEGSLYDILCEVSCLSFNLWQLCNKLKFFCCHKKKIPNERTPWQLSQLSFFGFI